MPIILPFSLYPGDVYFQNSEGVRINSERMLELEKDAIRGLRDVFNSFSSNPSAANYTRLENAMLKYQEVNKNWDRIVVEPDVEINEEVE